MEAFLVSTSIVALAEMGDLEGLWLLRRSFRRPPENLPELKAEVLRDLQARRGADRPLFSNPATPASPCARNRFVSCCMRNMR